MHLNFLLYTFSKNASALCEVLVIWILFIFQGLLILPLTKVKHPQASGCAEILCLLDDDLVILSYFKNNL